MAGIVLDAVAVARFGKHVEVEHRPLQEALGLEEFALLHEFRMVFVEFLANGDDGPREVFVPSHVVGPGEEGHPALPGKFAPGERIEAGQALHLVAEEPDPEADVLVAGDDLHRVAAHPEAAPLERGIVPHVLHLDELAEEGLTRGELGPLLEYDEHPVVGVRRAEAVDAGDAGDDQDIPSLEQRPGRGEAEPVNLLVDRGFLLDVGVARGDISLRLVVVVVADEVLDRVVGEEAPKLLVELGGERLVVRHDERRPVHRLDHPGNGIGLPGTRHSQEHLVRITTVEPLGELLDGSLLISARHEGTHHPKAPVGLRRGESGPRVRGRPLRGPRESRRAARHLAACGANRVSAEAASSPGGGEAPG